MPTQMNFEKGGGGYSTPGKEATVTSSQTNFDGGRTTKQGGKNKSKAQVNFDIGMSVPMKTVSSHFGEKPLTGNDNGY